MTTRSLEEASADFAQEMQATLDGVLPGERRIVSTRHGSIDRYVVGPEDRYIPVHVAAERLADLRIAIHLELDRTGTYLKAVRSDMAVYSVLDRTPLVRLEYRADMRTDPIAHWQMHAERGAFSHLLTRANVHRPARVAKPHDLSSVHLPVGGERFRPCLEDFLEFLVVDCGVDHQEGWADVACAGRERWRRRQLGAAVRDVQTEAARVLRELGWEVNEPPSGVDEYVAPFRKW
jgi:hypothetical protein